MNAALMDFASMISLNSTAQIAWDQYFLSGCRFGETRGIFEIEKPKKRIIFPTKDARIVVILHRDHRVYYSSLVDAYAPFLLPPTESDIRQTVQAYFRARFTLELSVRPIHAKYYDEKNTPIIACYAQVQKGVVWFREYEKSDIY